MTGSRYHEVDKSGATVSLCAGYHGYLGSTTSARMIEAILTGIVHADRLMEVDFCEGSGGLSPQISPGYKSFNA